MIEIRSGENRPWTDARMTAYVAGARVSGLLLGTDGRALGADAWVDEHRPGRAGVDHVPGAVQGVTVLLAEVDPSVAKVVVVVSGWAATPTAQLLTVDGAVALSVTPTSLTTERALVMVELYRRDGGWKVRALGQGYAGGLPALAAAYGAPEPTPVATPAPAAAPALGDPVRQIGMVLDDASRTTASYESSVAYAERRHEHDLEQLVGDPSLRMGPAADAARAQAQQRRDQLVLEARSRHRADLALLTTELETLARVLPPALAPWTAPGWEGHDPGATPAPGATQTWAFRLGELALASAPDFRLPMVRVLPMAPAVWIETEDGGDVTAARMMAALTTRVVVARPRAPRLSVVDVGDRARLGHLPTTGPPATDPGTASQVLHEHVEHLGLVALARRSGALADLPPEHRPGRLLLLPDFPGALDDSSVAAVHQLVVHGADCGVDVVLSGRRPESLGIAALDLVHDSCLRVPTAPGGDLVDAFGGVSWVFHPDLGPDDPFVAQRVQDVVRRRVAERDSL